MMFSPMLAFSAGLQEKEPEHEVIQVQDTGAIAVTDAKGVSVNVSLPVERIVSLNSGLSEIVAVLGASDRLIGRCSNSTFPSSIRSVFVVGTNSSHPNMEMILEIEPDLFLADAMFDQSKREILEENGIPVIIESTSDSERLPVIIDNLGRILNEEERAREVKSIVESALSRIRDLIPGSSEKPKVYFENRKNYSSASMKSSHHMFLELAGGYNIARDEPVKSPKLNPEFIVEQDPDVIVRRVSGDAGEDALEKMLQTIRGRPAMQETRAIQSGNVHIIKSDLFISLRYPVGVAYLASWFYPEELKGFDADLFHQKYITALYGQEEWARTREVYAYP